MTCNFCIDDIEIGDEYVIIDGHTYHYDCLAEMPLEDLLNLVGISVLTFEKED